MEVASGRRTDDEKKGYLHPDYAQSLAEFGNPQELPCSGGWVLVQDIPGFPYIDARGCYPLFACRDWSQLSTDLKKIPAEWVTLSLVTDPFGEYDQSYLQECFPDFVTPFKEHFVVDLCRPINTIVSGHHRRNARKAFCKLSVSKSKDVSQLVDEWVGLYSVLIERHKIKGISAFSRTAFMQQLKVPGLTAFRAMEKETTVGMVLWYVQGQVGYYHLGAYTPFGYKLGASFALFWSAIEYFAASGLKWLNLGAGAGVKNDGLDGLSAFKRGWSTRTKTAYLCGRIFNRTRYEEILKAKGVSAGNYFPAYRKGELCQNPPLKDTYVKEAANAEQPITQDSQAIRIVTEEVGR